MQILTCDQRSPEWYAARLGVPSASEFDKIITQKGEPSKQAQKYLYRLVGERLSGKPEETYTNGAMQRGVELEGEARSFYQLVHDVVVEQVGFCKTEGKTVYGCSPDGLIGQDGGLEIKCPNMATHVSYLINPDSLLSDYFQQVQGGLLVTGRKWWDLLSYYPGIKPLVIRIEPDKTFQKALAGALKDFCLELETTTKKLKGEA